MQTNVAHDLTLRVPHRVGAKVSVSGVAGEGERGGGAEYPRAESAVRVRGGGVERAGGPCACLGADTAEVVDLGVYGASEREGGAASVQRVPGATTEAVLGEPPVGQGLLCGHGGTGCGDDTEVCKMAGEAGEKARGVPV